VTTCGGGFAIAQMSAVMFRHTMSVACISDWGGAGARLGEARGEGSEESPMRRSLWTPLDAS
jgi:hypothetical protein